MIENFQNPVNTIFSTCKPHHFTSDVSHCDHLVQTWFPDGIYQNFIFIHIYSLTKAWLRRRTLHVRNLNDDVPCVEPKLSATDSVELNAFTAVLN